jgi:Protein of unknown function (DUF2877)
LILPSPGTVHVIAASASLHPLLQATSWQGAIAAVFHRSILCTAADARLLHLHTGSQLASPFSLCLDGDFTKVLGDLPLIRGMPVRKIGATIDIAEHIHLKLDEVRYYQSPTHRSGVIDPDAITIAWQVLRANGRGDGFEKLPGAQTTSTAIQQAIADRNPAQMCEATRHLIGWGPGLTPSGDDVLVGCLRALWLMPWNHPAVYQLLHHLRAALLPDLTARTTGVGAEFIRYALDGAFAEVLDQAALSLEAAFHPLLVQSAVSRLLAQGETSGTDTLLGLLICLEALLCVSDREPRHEGPDAPSVLLTSTATRT